MAGRYDRYWEMFEGTKNGPKHEVFKCTGCGAVTYPEDGHNGAPDPSRCADHCRHNHGDWKPGAHSDPYKVNFARIFPNSPGADL